MAWEKSGGRQAPAGSMVRVGPTGREQLVRSSGWQWSEEAEEIFLDALAASCNVTHAAEQAGFCTPTVYRQRRLRPEFAERWQAALEQGYARLEQALLQSALDSMSGVAFDENRPIPRMSVDQAMNVLRAHRNEVRGDGRRGPGQANRPPRLDEVRGSILKRIEAVKRARAPDGGEPA